MARDALVTSDVNTRHMPGGAAKSNLRAFKTNWGMETFLRTMRLFSMASPSLAARVGAFLFLRPRRKPITYVKQLTDEATKIHVVHNEKQLVAYQWGTGDKTILLVHGWESHLGHTLPLVQPLVDVGYKVIALDGPGHGQSPQFFTNMIDYGDAVKATLDQHGPFYGVVAKSFGGAATSLMLSREPYIQIDKLVLLSPMKHLLQHIGIFETILGYPDSMHTHIVNRIQRSIPLPIEECDVREAVTTFQMPGLIIHDLDDQVIDPEGSLEIAKKYPQSILQNTQGLGHKGLVHDQQVQQSIIDFLNQDE
ncbi:MAG: alpha/beta hydrolase [Chloroflexota bacterium]